MNCHAPIFATLIAVSLSPSIARADPPPAAPAPTPAPPPAPRLPLPALALTTPREGPDRLEYQPGAPIPPGYEKRVSTRSGMLVAGTTLFGAGYVGGVIFSYGNDADLRGLSFIPIVGPVIPPAVSPKIGAAMAFVTVPLAIAETAGITLALVSLLAPRIELVRPRATWLVTPSRLGGGAYGLSAYGVF